MSNLSLEIIGALYLVGMFIGWMLKRIETRDQRKAKRLMKEYDKENRETKDNKFPASKKGD